MRITIVGSGDAFGSGGRLNTCFHVEAGEAAFLVDCGATSLPAIKQLGLDRNAIRTIFVTHYVHADHFGGIPAFILDAHFLAKRTAPLTIAGPAGLGDFMPQAMETAFSGASMAGRRFDVEIRELEPGRRATVNGIDLTPFVVRHGQPEERFFCYRFEHGGNVFAYSGDTEWTDALIEAGRGADLFICECYAFDRRVPLHTDYATLKPNLPRIGARRVMLTHMSEGMLAHAAGVPEEKAEDGLVILL